MSLIRPLVARLWALFRRNHLEADMAEEMRVHLEMQEQANRAAVTGFNGGL